MPQGEVWSNEALYEHFTTLRAADQAALLAAIGSANLRLDGMNEFRGTLNDAQKTFITRGEVYALCVVATSVGGLIGGLVGHIFR